MGDGCPLMDEDEVIRKVAPLWS